MSILSKLKFQPCLIVLIPFRLSVSHALSGPMLTMQRIGTIPSSATTTLAFLMKHLRCNGRTDCALRPALVYNRTYKPVGVREWGCLLITHLLIAITSHTLSMYSDGMKLIVASGMPISLVLRGAPSYL
ncbi:hypothetical protein PMIN01_00211 [Paraphaeosphaeria minitans]|uniref:Secreted protein n=1 Tax=Paraphaeosphaeria minitans TaxID=565426 RepID=A0A9P6GRR6_9PLEO|nr:hypothetical protein PMIN01_00211 [Paraphaeosphaeria minitans]